MVFQSTQVPPDTDQVLKIPAAQFFDRFSRSDELQIQNLQALKALMDLIARTSQHGPTGPAGFDTLAFKQKLLNAEYKPYVVKSYPLDTARADEEISLDGQTIMAWTNGSFSGCGVRLNNKNECDLIYFDNYNPTPPLPFQKVFLTTTAQTGKTLRLFISKEPFTALSLTDLETTLVQKFHVLRTDKDTYFTTAIVQWAKDDENVAGLFTNAIRITGVAIQSDQALNYRLIFYGTDGFDNTDLDLDLFQSEVGLDIPSYGFQVASANQYYMAVNGLSIDYEDEDGTRELHVSLQDLSATSKNAGATGEVSLAFFYEERE